MKTLTGEVDKMKNESKSETSLESESKGHLWRGFGDSIRHTPLPNIDRVKKLALGQNHALILTESGIVFATGSNSHGQLGNGTTSDNVDIPFKISSLEGKETVDVACGSRHSGAVDKSGRLFMWGNNESDQCASNDGVKFLLVPTRVRFPEQYTECIHGRRRVLHEPRIQRLFCGENHTVALTTKRELWTWGKGTAMGLPNVTHSAQPQRVEFLGGRHVLGVACGGYHTVALVSTVVIDKTEDDEEDEDVGESGSCPWCDANGQDGCEENNDSKVCPLGVQLTPSGQDEKKSIVSVSSKPSLDGDGPSSGHGSVEQPSVEEGLEAVEEVELLDKGLEENVGTGTAVPKVSESAVKLGAKLFRSMSDAVVGTKIFCSNTSSGGSSKSDAKEENAGIENAEDCNETVVGEDFGGVAKKEEEEEDKLTEEAEEDDARSVPRRKNSASFVDAQSAKEFLTKRLSSIASAMSPSALTQNASPSAISRDSVFVYETATETIRQNMSALTSMVVSGVRNTVDRFGFVSKHLSRDYDLMASMGSLDGASSAGSDFEILEEPSSLLLADVPGRKGWGSSPRSFRIGQRRKMSGSSRCGSLDASLPGFELDPTTCVLKEPTNSERPWLATEVWSWGQGNMGQLGQGDGLDRLQPSCINMLRNRGIIKVDAGLCHTIAVTAGGQCYVWGYNSHGQLGNPNHSVPGYSPQIIKLESSALVWDVATGNKHTVLLADRGLQTELYYCGKQEGPLPGVEVDGPVPLSGAIGTTQPLVVSVTGSEGRVRNVRRVFAGGFLCGCVSDPSLPAHVLTIRELSASERCFYQTMTLFKDAVLDPLVKDPIYSPIVSSPFGPGVESLVSAFQHLWHQVSLNNLTLGRAMRVPPSRCNLSNLVDHVEGWVSAFERYAAAYLDLYACNGLMFCSKTASSFLVKTQPFKQEDKSTVEVLSRLLEEPFHRMTEYQRSFDILAEQYKQAKMSSFREAEVSKRWAILATSFNKEKQAAETTRGFWDSCPQKIADSVRAPNRRLLRESRANPLTLSSSGRFSSNWFILLNDVLVHSQFSSCTIYTLPLIWVDPLPDTDVLQNAFTIMMPEETLTLHCPSSQEKTEWICTLNQAIRACLVKGQTFATVTSRLSGSMKVQQRLSPPLARTATYTFTKKPLLKDSTYVGTWLCAKMHGHGELTWPDGRKYTGKFKQNIECGDGLYIAPSPEGNTISEGIWRDGKLNGLGSIRYPNGDLYEGYLKDGLCHGHGVLKKGQFMSSAASVYIGEWARGYRHGYGVIDDIVNGEKYMGQWAEDERHGNGLMVTLDGVYYEGSFVHNKMMGHGLVIFEDDSWYEGEFSGTGGFGGKGTLILAGGDRIEGTFSGLWNEGIKVNGTIHKLNARAEPVKPQSFATLCVSAEEKWRDIFRHCEEMLGVSIEADCGSSASPQRVWESVAVIVIDWKKRLTKYSTRSYAGIQELDGLDRIPQMASAGGGGRLTLEEYREMEVYLCRAFDCSYHPLGKLMEGVVDVYRATYVGVGAHPRLLSHAVAEVQSLISRMYAVVRLLFPKLPDEARNGVKVRPASVAATAKSVESDEDDDDEDEESVVVTASVLILPILLPRIYPPLFTLYALHNEKDDAKYWEALLKWNRQSDLALMTYLGVDPKFWFTENTGDIQELRKTVSSIKDEHFSKAVDCLQHLSTTFSPTEKLRVIYRTFQEITKEVHISLGEDFIWTMDSLFPVFQYVVVRARIRHLGSEVLMIDDLMEPHLQHGELGIMFTTLKACYFQVKREQALNS